MTTPVNIIEDRITPNSIGEYIDALLIANIRMWHAQELFFDLENLERLSHEEILKYLTYATWLNLDRNKQMDNVDAQLVDAIGSRGYRHVPSTSMVNGSATIWESS